MLAWTHDGKPQRHRHIGRRSPGEKCPFERDLPVSGEIYDPRKDRDDSQGNIEEPDSPLYLILIAADHRIPPFVMFPVGNPVALEFHRDPLLFQKPEEILRQPVLRHSAGKGEAEFSIIGNRPALHPLLRGRAHEELERFHLIPQLLPDIHPPDI